MMIGGGWGMLWFGVWTEEKRGMDDEENGID
jgi:hypothetical protein